MVLGNDLGGLHFLRQYFNADVDVVSDKEDKYKLYPNPAANNVTVEREGGITAPVSIKIIAPTGQAFITQDMIATSKITIDTSVLPAGIYYCIIKQDAIQIAKPLVILR
jgi:hypothetical protein